MPAKAWGELFDFFAFGADDPRPPYTEEGKYAVVDVCGPLTQKPGWWGESYVEIRGRAAAAFASGADAVCLKFDSPGGDYAGCLELARDLRSMAQASGKRLVAFTDTSACSAAYALATAADEIVTTESAQIGSVGVWAPLVDVTAQDAMYGVKFAVAASGKAKADRNPHLGISDEAFARLQSQIDDMAARFFDLVAEHRPGVAAQAVRALEGADFFGSRGLAAGLSDRIVNSWQAFLSEEGSPMTVKASKYDEAVGALKRAAEGDDEDAKKAKKALKAIDDGEKPEGSDSDPDKDGDKDAEKDKKDGEEAKALAIKLAGDVAGLRAQLDERDARDAKTREDAARAALFASRPDLNDAQRKVLEGMPVEQAKAIVDTWPRVTAQPGAAAGAMTPTVVAEDHKPSAYQPRLTKEQAEIIARLDAVDDTPKRAFTVGTTTHTPHMSRDAAASRLAELNGKGAV